MFEELIGALQAWGIAIHEKVAAGPEQTSDHGVVSAARPELYHRGLAKRARRQPEMPIERMAPFDMPPEIRDVLARRNDPVCRIEINKRRF